MLHTHFNFSCSSNERQLDTTSIPGCDLPVPPVLCISLVKSLQSEHNYSETCSYNEKHENRLEVMAAFLTKIPTC